MSYPYFRKALKNTFISTLFEIPTQGRWILSDINCNFVQCNFIFEMVEKICIYAIYRFIGLL